MKLQVVFQPFTHVLEEPSKRVEHHQESRPSVKDAITYSDGSIPAANLIGLFKNLDFESQMGQSQSGRQSAETGSNDGDPFAHRSFLHHSYHPMVGRTRQARANLRIQEMPGPNRAEKEMNSNTTGGQKNPPQKPEQKQDKEKQRDWGTESIPDHSHKPQGSRGDQGFARDSGTECRNTVGDLDPTELDKGEVQIEQDKDEDWKSPETEMDEADPQE
jgi:hypothetical protein